MKVKLTDAAKQPNHYRHGNVCPWDAVQPLQNSDLNCCCETGGAQQGGVFPIDACCNMSLLRLGASMPCHRSLVSQAKVANLLARYDRTGRHKGCRSQNAILGMVPGSGQTL